VTHGSRGLGGGVRAHPGRVDCPLHHEGEASDVRHEGSDPQASGCDILRNGAQAAPSCRDRAARPGHLGANGYRYSGRADLYLSHPDFVTRDETNAPGSVVWLTDAMKAYALRETQASAQRGGFEQANAALVLLS